MSGVDCAATCDESQPMLGREKKNTEKKTVITIVGRNSPTNMEGAAGEEYDVGQDAAAVESASHVSSLGCFEVEPNIEATEVAAQELSAWDVDTSGTAGTGVSSEEHILRANNENCIVPPTCGISTSQLETNGISHSNNFDINAAEGIRWAQHGMASSTMSTIGTPTVGSTYSISSRGYTSVTAPSTAGSVSSDNSSGTARAKNVNSSASASTQNSKIKLGVASNSQLPKQNQQTSSSVPNAQSKEDVDNVDRIDSALLSALNDSKERMGLLRLEQVLIDFMNERTTGYIEVGGPNNSIVIGGQVGGRLATNISAEEIRGRQTSFQRLCLHRLADRFNIVRESASTSLTPAFEEYPSSGVAGSVVPGLIRLVKVKDSRIPENLLIDLDLSTYSCPTDSRELDYCNPGTNTKASTTDVMRNLTESMSSSNLGSGGETPVGNRKQSKQPSRKMMIMKRNSETGSGSTGSEKGRHGQGRGNRKGKKFSEKEKAYAEARARIFNEIEERRKAESNLASSASISPSISRETFSPYSSSPTSGFCERNTDTERTSTVISDAASNSELEVESDLPSFSGKLTEPVATSAKASSNSASSGNTASGAASAAAAAANVSKVTWRNRRQEENDPDFRRGVVRPLAGTAPVSPLIPSQYPYASPSLASGVLHTHPSSGYVQGSDPSYSLIQQHQSVATSESSGSYHQQQVYYSSHAQYSSSGTAPSRSSFVHSQQSPYYLQHQQYYGQPAGQVHQRSGNGGFASTNSSLHHGMLYTNSAATTSTERRTGNIVYSMEEFPPIR